LVAGNRERTIERVIASARDFPNSAPNPLFVCPDFSPDDQRVVYSCFGCDGVGDSPSIWVSPLHGGAPARVTPPSSHGIEPSWSPDGQWIAYVDMTDMGHLAVAKIRVGSGEDPVRILESYCHQLAWSPVNNEILCSDPHTSWIVSPEGKRKKDLQGIFWAATWAPDGKIIYGIRYGESPTHLYAVDAESGKWKSLVELPRGFRPAGLSAGTRMSVSPDRKSVAVGVFIGDGDIWILDGFQVPRSLWQRIWPFQR
jgi:Tol biopolymer transport system component